MSVLIIAEHNNSSLSPSTLNAITAAEQLADDLHILVVGSNCGGVAEGLKKIIGIKKVLLVDDPIYTHQLAENVSKLIADIGANYTHIVSPATAAKKDLMPRVAALLDVAQISDVIEIETPTIFKRGIYAGNAIATVESLDSIRVLTVRTTAFSDASEGNNEAIVDSSISIKHVAIRSKFISSELNSSDRPELTAARIVISGGRGMGSESNFSMLTEIADKLDAAVGASRAAVDSGYASNDLQVGQTGKIVAPDLYIAVGISGAIQHLAGMKDSKVIAAINKDEEAPIFSVADYGIVDDLFKCLPELIEHI